MMVPARVGLVGNPSDGYGGAVLATVVPSLMATVTARLADGVEVASDLGSLRWSTVADFLADAETNGHTPEQRIVTAALAVTARHLGVGTGVRIEWSTTIPRSVGLAGSSALAVGVVRAVAAVWRRAVATPVVAALALSAEVDELGLAAGWQDRMVQAHGGTVLVEAGVLDTVDGWQVPRVTAVHPPRPIGLLVGWSAAAAESSDRYHGALRTRTDVASAMAELGRRARAAADAVATGDLAGLAEAMDDAWRIRQAVAPLAPAHTALVEAVRATGVAATTPGSGGSVVALPLDDEQHARAVDALTAFGAGITTTVI